MPKGTLLLAGDIGGTKTKLALYEKDGIQLSCVQEKTYASGDYASFDEIIAAFLGGTQVGVVSACFGVAGPVEEGRCQTTNLPWLIEADRLAKLLNIFQVSLLNDLEAMAIGLLHLSANELIELNPTASLGRGNKAVAAAGTGFGEALLYWDGQRYHPIATEGGHTDFAPNTREQDDLLVYLRGKFGGHVSYERILSGPGLFNIYQFLKDNGRAPESPELSSLIDSGEDPGRWIGQFALERGDLLCRETLRIFVEIYGAEVGNWALKTLARGGVLIGGGIAAKILPLLLRGSFMSAFADKGRFSEMLASFSVRVSLNTDAGLLGAAQTAKGF